MPISEYCHRDLVAIDQGALLAEAARLMRSRHVGLLVVTAEETRSHRVVGIVTDRDLAIEFLARDLPPTDVRIGQIAQHELVAVEGEADLGTAVLTMQQHGVRRLLVVEADGHLQGVVSVDDLTEALAAQLTALAGALRNGITREAGRRPALTPLTTRPVFLPVGTPGMP